MQQRHPPPRLRRHFSQACPAPPDNPGWALIAYVVAPPSIKIQSTYAKCAGSFLSSH
jgi:hypothetical protein